jgi:hypothetical protein
MFVWLMSLSVVPVVVYYYSIKHQENTLDRRAEMIHLAQANLAQNKNHEDYSVEKWTEPTNGTGIDGFKIEVLKSDPNDLDLQPGDWQNRSEGFPGKIVRSVYAYLNNEYMDEPYRELRSPLTKDDYMLSLIQRSNDKKDWTFRESLIYTSPSMNGSVQVFSESSFLNLLKYVLRLISLITIPVIIWLIFMWYVFYYIADLVLGTIIGNWNYPSYPEWEQVLEAKRINRILLVAFDAKKYAARVKPESMEEIHAYDIFDKSETILQRISADKKVIWISGLGEYLLKHKQAGKRLSGLNELLLSDDRKIVVEMPYDLDFVKEYFNEIVCQNHCSQGEEVEILNYMSDLKHLFSRFYRYTGSIDLEQIQETLQELNAGPEKADLSEKQILADAHLMKLQYSYIWNNLSRMEKLILFDLADDGMMNFKNRFLINRLKMKGLLKLKPTPQVFHPSFQYFLKYSVDETETALLERQLGKEGKWKNTRYLILLLLIPLAAFMFISQGTSIERVVGILTGVIALFSGAMKLMDTGLFSGVSKQS